MSLITSENTYNNELSYLQAVLEPVDCESKTIIFYAKEQISFNTNIGSILWRAYNKNKSCEFDICSKLYISAVVHSHVKKSRSIKICKTIQELKGSDYKYFLSFIDLFKKTLQAFNSPLIKDGFNNSVFYKYIVNIKNKLTK